MTKKPKGQLLIIGGHEDKDGDCVILKEIAKQAKHGLVIVSVASQEPEAMIKQYTMLFTQLGVKKVDALDIRQREEASDAASVNKLDEAPVLFFTGGDQLRITS